MAEYIVRDPTGRAYRITGPEGASQETLQAVLQRQLSVQQPAQQVQATSSNVERMQQLLARMEAERDARAAQRAPAPVTPIMPTPAEPDTNLLGQIGTFFKTIPGGAIGLGETAALGLAALLPEEQELAARESIQSTAESLSSPFQAGAGYEDSMGAKLGAGLGSVAAFAPLALLGPVGAIAGGVGLGGAAAAGEASERARAAGATEEERSRAALLGIIPGAAEALPFGAVGRVLRLGRGLAKEVGEEVATDVVSRLARVGRTAGEEALQEAAQEVAQNLIAKGVYDPEQGVFVGSGESAGVGAGVGAIVQGLIELAIPGRPRAGDTGPTEQPTEEPVETPEEPVETPEEPVDAESAITEEQAREAEALAAAEADDAAAFEQPDLFTRELQEAREARPDVALREQLSQQGERVPQRESITPEAPTTPAPTQEDVVERIDQIKRDDAEIAEIEAMLRADEQVIAEVERMRRQSEVESMDARREGERQRESEQKRYNILQQTIENTPTRNYNTLSKNFEKALADQGIANPKASERELEVIRRAVNVQRAEKPEAPTTPEITSPPETTQLAEMEARIPERGERRSTTPSQQSFPGLGRRKTPPVEEPLPAPKIVTKEFMDGLGISPKAPIRKLTEGKDLNDPAVREKFVEFANNPKVGQQARLNVARELEGVPEAQMELFQPKPRGRAEQQVEEQARAAAAAVEKAMVGPEAEVDPDVEAEETGAAEEAEAQELAEERAAREAERTGAGPVTGVKLSEGLPREVIDRVRRGVASEAEQMMFDAVLEEEYVGDIETDQMLADLGVVDRTDSDYLNIEERALYEADKPLPEGGMDAARENNIADALDAVAKRGTNRVLRNIARALKRGVGGVNIAVVDNLVNYKGESIPGRYNPQTNTIELNSTNGDSVHVLLHESSHAALFNTLKNPSSPITRQLQKLFDEAVPQLGTAYGTASLQEFVAEALSNVTFRNKLKLIKNPGAKVTLWQRFSNSVVNFVRRLLGLEARPVGSVRASIDTIIDGLLAPTPDTVKAGKIYDVYNGEGLTSGIREAFSDYKNGVNTSDTAIAKTVRALSDYIFSPASGTGRKVVLGALHLKALADIAHPKLKGVADGLLAEGSAAGEASRFQKNTVVEQVKALRGRKKSDPKGYKVLMGIINDSTRLQVDPSLTRQEADKKYAKSPRRLKKYKELRTRWDNMGKTNKELQDQYVALRNAYKTMYDNMMAALRSRIDNMGADVSPQTKANLKKFVDDLAQKQNNIEPFFPLVRQGEYRIAYKAYDPVTGEVTTAYEHFVRKSAMDTRVAELKQSEVGSVDAISTDPDAFQVAEISTFKGEAIDNYRRTAVPGSFVNDVLAELDQAGVNETVKEDIFKMYLNSLPEQALPNMFRNRKGSPGFIEDPAQALEIRGIAMVDNIVRLRTAPALDKLQSELDAVRPGVDEPGLADMKAELQARLNFIRNPSVEGYVRFLNTLGFGYTLGFNISSAIVNTAQIPLVVFPVLAGKTSLAEATKSIGGATKLFMGSGFTKKQRLYSPIDGKEYIDKTDTPSIENYFGRDENGRYVPLEGAQLPEGVGENITLESLAILLNEAGNNRGLVETSLTQVQSDTDQIEAATSPAGRAIAKVKQLQGWLFHKNEVMNRQVALVASFDTEIIKMKKRLGVDTLSDAQLQEAAVNASLETVDMTGNNMNITAGRFFQKGFTKTALMYKSYAVAMYYLMAKLGKKALVGESVEVRNEGRKQLAGIFVMTGATSGLLGMPVMGIISTVFDMFREDDEDDFDTLVRKQFGEGVATGLLGPGIAPRVSMNSLLFRENRFYEQENMILSVLEQAGGPLFGIASRVESGVRGLKEANNAAEQRRAIERMLPAAIANPMKAMRFADEGPLTLRGDSLLDEDLGGLDILAQAIGFMPADYVLQLEKNARAKGITRAITERATALRRRYYLAMRVRDIDEMRATLQEIREYNRRHPANRIDHENLMQSVDQHFRTSAEMINGITIPARLRAEMMQWYREFQ